jgi:uncharacterized membrane-anchored protein
MRSRISLVVALVTAGALQAQEPQKPQSDFERLPWVPGPAAGQLGEEATVQVPAGCLFTGVDGVARFMELTENPVGGDERGVVFCMNQDTSAAPWFVIFSYQNSGYVRDDEKDELDADAIIASIREGTEAANEERQRRGWGTLTIEGWVTQPFYDAASNNLTWALSAADQSGGRSVNHSVRLLGRGGVMKADLVAAPEQLADVMPIFGGIVSGFEYQAGHRYAEWRQGDRVAAYGLTALVAGGIAAKTGILAKFWKLIVAGVVAVGAFFKSIVRRFTSGGDEARVRG